MILKIKTTKVKWLVYTTRNDLEKLRKVSNLNGSTIELYAVCHNLNNPIIKIRNLTKKYVYWEDGSQHPYPSKNAGYRLFSNKSEAWKYFKLIYDKRKKYIEEQHKLDLENLKKATEILNNCIDNTPEYFL